MAKMGRPKNNIVKKWRTRAWYCQLEKLLGVKNSPFKVDKFLDLLGSDKGSKFSRYMKGEASPDASSTKLIYAALIKKMSQDERFGHDKEAHIQKCNQVFSYLDHPIWQALSGNKSVQAGKPRLEESISTDDYTTEGGKICMLGGEPFSETVNVPDSSEKYTLMKTGPELVRAEPEDLFHLLVSGAVGSPQEILLVVLIKNIEVYRTMNYRTQEIFESLCENIKKANDVLESDFYITANDIIEYISLWERMGNLNEIEVPEYLRLK